jgi:hypothetical protein
MIVYGKWYFSLSTTKTTTIIDLNPTFQGFGLIWRANGRVSMVSWQLIELRFFWLIIYFKFNIKRGSYD